MKNYRLSKNEYFSKAVDRLNSIQGFNNHFIFHYIENEDWYNIYHNVEEVIQKSDDFAKIIGDILYEELIQYDIINFSIFEDEEKVASSIRDFKATSIRYYNKNYNNKKSQNILSEKIKIKKSKSIELKIAV